ncbi:MAG: site-specific DNA-methyltransferase [Clostridiales bacterium]|jgi:site-specific DNA-methyltransferase (adenine-specific)|nr:site-specific DNA-methyltransferase [Clostridiales bacterium]
MKTNVIINGECVEELNKLPAESIDLIFADPPYWMRVDGVLNRPSGSEYDGCADEWDNQFSSLEDYKSFTKSWLNACVKVLKPNGSIWVIGGMQCVYTIGAIMQDLNLWFINDVIWWKTNPTPNFKGTRINNAHETMIWATKGKSARYTFNYKTAKELNKDTVFEKDFNAGIRKQLGSVWRIGVCQGEERLKDENGVKLHSTQKPESILYRIIALNSKLGDIVLDPFGGTMTTGTVAKRMGRKYIMIENNRQYCEFGQKRLDAVKECIGDIEKAIFDSKPPRVSFEEMIQAGYFKVGEKLFYNSKPYFFLTENGKIIRQDSEPLDIHTAIARVKNSTANRLNGWDYWEVRRNNEFVSIDNIRQKYISEVKYDVWYTKNIDGFNNAR